VAALLGGAAPALGAEWTATGGQAGANLGISVGRAGDVNGDGFDDVVVGAYLHDNGQVNEARAVRWSFTALPRDRWQLRPGRRRATSLSPPSAFRSALRGTSTETVSTT
jgi:hypothetical protein